MSLMEKKDIQDYSYAISLKNIILSLMNVIGQIEDYIQVKKTAPEYNRLLTWVIEAQLAQLNEIMTIHKDHEKIKNIYDELNKLCDTIREMNDKIDTVLIMDRLRDLSVKIMTNIANLSTKLEI